MIKTLTRHGNSYALIIDRAILDLLKLTPESPLEISTDGAALIVQPVQATDSWRRFDDALKPSEKHFAAARSGRSRHRATLTLKDLRRRRAAILGVAARHGAGKVRVFGSVARGDAGPESDVDLLVEMGTDRSLFDQVALMQDLGELLQRRVDVVSDRGLNARIRRQVLDEAVPL